MCTVSVVLMSMRRLFHHCGVRTAVLVLLSYMGYPHGDGVESLLAVADHSGQVGGICFDHVVDAGRA